MKKSGRNLSEHEKDRGSYTAAVVKYFKGLDKEDYGGSFSTKEGYGTLLHVGPKYKVKQV